jgi:hypothetical protein
VHDPVPNGTAERDTLPATGATPATRVTHATRAEWHDRASKAVGQLLIIFIGVTAAFMADEYRGRLGQQDQLRQARAGIVAELARYEMRALEHADGITASIERWRNAESEGERAIPGFYRIPGATHPPTAGWDAAVSSGVASLFDPQLRLELGYFYTEFVGVHDNYVRYLEFSEREHLPRAELGAAAFYDSAGTLLPEFRVQMMLLEEFGSDLRRLSALAGELRRKLEDET